MATELRYLPVLDPTFYPGVVGGADPGDPRYALVGPSIYSTVKSVPPAVWPGGAMTPSGLYPKVYSSADLVRMLYGVKQWEMSISVTFTETDAENPWWGIVETIMTGGASAAASSESELVKPHPGFPPNLSWQGSLAGFTRHAVGSFEFDGSETTFPAESGLTIFPLIDVLETQTSAYFETATGLWMPRIQIGVGAAAGEFGFAASNHPTEAPHLVLNGTFHAQPTILNMGATETMTLVSATWSLEPLVWWPYIRDGGPTFDASTGAQLKPQYP